MWFVEEQTFSGGWAPATYDQYPPKKWPGHHVVFRRDPIPVPDYLVGLDLSAIASCLSPSGEFYGYDEQTHQALAEYIKGPDVGPFMLPRVVPVQRRRVPEKCVALGNM